MLERVDLHSRVAVYLQIENNLRFAIAAGELKPGERLPSVRELSESLDVNPNTVAKAYRDLETLGLLRARRGMGVFVKDDITDRSALQTLKDIAAHVYSAVGEAKACGISQEVVKGLISDAYAVDGSPYLEPPAAYLKKASARYKKRK